MAEATSDSCFVKKSIKDAEKPFKMFSDSANNDNHFVSSKIRRSRSRLSIPKVSSSNMERGDAILYQKQTLELMNYNCDEL